MSLAACVCEREMGTRLMMGVFVGTLFALLFIFFTLQFPKHGSIQLRWWGNSVYENRESLIVCTLSWWLISVVAADWKGTPLVSTDPNTGF